jgi:signal transduction histidine kinase
MQDEILSNPKEIFYHQIAWNQPDNNVSYVTEENSNRSWNVLETIKNKEGEKVALVFLSFPLKEFDKMNNRSETFSYLILIFTVLIVLLLMANNARLFGYALTLTKLKEVDQMKDTFISMASHELKAPLTAMKGNIEFFKEEMEHALNENGQHYIDNISTSVVRLEMLVGDILEVSRLEGNRIPINISTVDPGQILEKSIEEIKAQAVQKNIELDYAPEKLPQVLADPERLKQVVVNLLSNAVKYTLKGKVEVLSKVDGKILMITVADSGVGISAEDQKKLFQKFSRVLNEETKMVSGTGLGLWISRELIQKMGGDITVESIRGVGSHFTIHLPVA